MTIKQDTGKNAIARRSCLLARARTQARVAELAHAQRLPASRRPGDLSEDDAAERPEHGLNA